MSARLPLLLALQACPHDAEAAWSLLRLIADICPQKRYTDVDLLVSVRRDTALDMKAVAYAGRAFSRTWTFRTQTLAIGWPAGCNRLAEETVHHWAKQNQLGRWNYPAMFLIEADGLPMRPDWLEHITQEWAASDKLISGHYDIRSIQQDHVNGNLIVHRQFASLFPRFPDAPRDLAWDYHWRKECCMHAHRSLHIFNDYALGTPRNPLLGEEHLFGPRASAALEGLQLIPKYLHGSKLWRDSHSWIRNRFALKESLT